MLGRGAAAETLQLGEGLFFTGLRWRGAATYGEIADRIATAILQGKALGATAAGGSLRLRRLCADLAEEALRTPLAAARIEGGWEAVLCGTLRNVRPECLARLLGGRVLRYGERTEVLPGEQAIPALVWVGDTPKGYVLAELRNARSEGLRLAFSEAGVGLLPFRFTAEADAPGDEDPPFRLVFFEGKDLREAVRRDAGETEG